MTVEARKSALLYDFDGENEECEAYPRRIDEHPWTEFRRQFRLIIRTEENQKVKMKDCLVPGGYF
jgi:hypothetical protein